MKVKISSLNNLFKYTNENVVKRYVKDYGGTRAFAKKMLHELLKFLWLSKKGKQVGISIPMYAEMRPIDYMWHTFILFTRDYSAFGEKYFDGYIHHQPTTVYQPSKKVEEEFFRFYGFVYDQVGQETLDYWFDMRTSKNLPLKGADLKDYCFAKCFKRHFERERPKYLSFKQHE